MAAKKKRQVLGRGKPVTTEITYIKGAAIIDSEERAVEVLTMVEQAELAMKPVQEFIASARNEATGWMLSSAVDIVQLENSYYHRIQRHSRFWVTMPNQMPSPKPKGAKSVKEIVKGMTVKVDGKTLKLWNLITRRVVDPVLIDKAVKKGWITEKEIGKAYIETPQKPFVQRFSGEYKDED